MRLGAHTAKLSDPNLQRLHARNNNWTVSQTMYSPAQSLTIPNMPAYYDKSITPGWIFHAAYVSSINPGERSREGCTQYIKAMLYHAQQYNIESVVIHSGAVSAKPVQKVLTEIETYINDWGIRECLEKGKTTLSVEIPATTCGFSLRPDLFAERYEGSSIGWCLDLAHCHAAGLGWTTLRTIIDKYPPFVCHANFAGSAFGSSRDIHGCRTHPHLEKKGKLTTCRDNATVDWLTKEYDETIRLLVEKNVPLITERSNFNEYNMTNELLILKEIASGY